MSTIRLFEEESLAKLYAKFRPSYPQKVYNAISLFATKRGIDLKTGLALDLACGSGQGTFPLTNIVEKCIGVDISRAQINFAKEKNVTEGNDAVEFMVADAHSLPFENDKFDLVTCSTAWHWFDPKAACPEVSRVLKKPGCLAVYSYAPFSLRHPECDRILQNFFDTLSSVWHPRDKLVVDHYKDVELPYPVLERHDISVRVSMTVNNLVGFLESLGCYKTLCEKNPGIPFLDNLATQLKSILDADSTAQINGAFEEIEASIPMFLLLCAKD